MKRVVAIILFLASTALGFGQTHTITGTATDSDGQVWNSGTYRIEFNPNPSYPNLSQYYVAGVPLSNYQTVFSGSLNSGGSFSQSNIMSNLAISPVGSTYRIYICPHASSPCGTFILALTSDTDITSPINANIKAPRFDAVAGAFGYNNFEANPHLVSGSTYYNVLNTCQTYYNAITSSWACAGSSTTTISTPTQLLSGCGVNWIGTLSFTVGACSYTINGIAYSSPLTTITLPAADPSNPRIDVIGVNTSSAVFSLQGIPSASPSQPTVDPASQLTLTFVTVPTSSSIPAGVTTNTIFDEGVEWPYTTSGSPGVLSTNNPYHLTRDFEATNPTGYFYFAVPSSGSVNLQNWNNLILYIRSKGSFTSPGQGIKILWQSGSTNFGNQVLITDGTYGFNSSITGTYQQISIPVSAFGTGSTNLQNFAIVTSNPSSTTLPGWYIDYVQLQGGIAPIAPSTVVNWKGVWNSSTAYSPNDLVVSSGGVGYVALVSNTNVALTTTSTWASLAPTTVAAQPAEFATTLSGIAGANQLFLLVPIVYTTTTTIASSCSGSYFGATVAATASYAITIKKLAGGPLGTATTLCTATFAISGTVATFSGTGGTLAAGDYLQIIGPATGDTTLANFGGGIYATH